MQQMVQTMVHACYIRIEYVTKTQTIEELDQFHVDRRSMIILICQQIFPIGYFQRNYAMLLSFRTSDICSPMASGYSVITCTFIERNASLVYKTLL